MYSSPRTNNFSADVNTNHNVFGLEILVLLQITVV
jgi:hypothetical protein